MPSKRGFKEAYFLYQKRMYVKSLCMTALVLKDLYDFPALLLLAVRGPKLPLSDPQVTITRAPLGSSLCLNE